METNRQGSARAWAALPCGLVFGWGLCWAQMVNPLKVLAFLDVAGHWDPSLMIVMGAAVVTASAGYTWVLRQPGPLLDSTFSLPTRHAIDTGLVLGAALFGIGWGVAGYCPGPAIATLGAANPEAFWFVPALFAGAWLQRWQARRVSAPSGPAHAAADG